MNVTKEQIDQWKQEHGSVFCFKSDGKQAYFRTTTLKEMEAAAEQKSSVKYNQVIARSCFLGGDQELIDQDRYFKGIIPQLDKLVKEFDVEVEKL